MLLISHELLITDVETYSIDVYPFLYVFEIPNIASTLYAHKLCNNTILWNCCEQCDDNGAFRSIMITLLFNLALF